MFFHNMQVQIFQWIYDKKPFKNAFGTLSWIRGVRGHLPIFKQKYSILGLDFDFAFKELIWKKIIILSQRITNLWTFWVLNKNFNKDVPGFEPGTSRTQAWNTAQWPIFKQFYYWFLARKNANLNLNNLSCGRAQEHLKKSVNCPVLYPPPNIISFDWAPPQ